MRTFVAWATVGTLALLAVGTAFAAERKGEVGTIDRQKRIVAITGEGECICTATPYVIAAGVDFGWLSEGVVITVTYTTEGGVNTITKIAK